MLASAPTFWLIVEERKPNLMSLAIFYFTYYALNMFRTLIYPSLGACDCVDELPHRSSCSQFVVCWSFCCGWYMVVFVLQVEALLVLVWHWGKNIFPTILTETSFILRIIQRVIIKNVSRSSLRTRYAWLVLVKLENLLDRISKNTHISHFTKICPVGAEFFHADVHTDRQIWRRYWLLFQILLKLIRIKFTALYNSRWNFRLSCFSQNTPLLP